MGNLKLYPNKLIGEVKIPPSKSIAHRAVICAALASGTSKIRNINLSDDIIATIEGMKSLGAVIENKGEYLEIVGIDKEKNLDRTIDCNESGSTLRFLIPVSLATCNEGRFIGKGNLGKRPLDTYYEIFDKQGIDYKYNKEKLDLYISGKLNPGEFKVEGNISSQFITGLMFSLPLLNGDSKIVITTELESRGYLDLTINTMKEFGIIIENNDYKEFYINGNQKYKSIDYKVEGDFSQGAFYLCADAIGSKVDILDLNTNSSQGDKEIISILDRMGMKITSRDKIVSGVADKLDSTVIDASQCPDIIPVVSVVASLCKGTTEIINAKRLRIKECDRLSAVALELSKLGAKITEKEDGLIIQGVEKFTGGVEVWSHNDHRIAMTLAIASTICTESIILKDYECVSKSYPNFFDDFKMLGGEFYEWHVGK